jgi:murein DD-endopeptidase MepM/ murein hydrolase activator NlpD
MREKITRLNHVLAKYIPEQRIYMRSESSTRVLRLSPLTQTVLGSAVVVGFCWTVIATSAVMLNSISAKSQKVQTAVLQEAYDTRLQELSAERDQRSREAVTAQDRFYVALDQISLQQSELLEAEEIRRELATGLKMMQQKLQSAIKERDFAEENSERILAEMQALSGNVNTRLDMAADTKDTLSYLTGALGETVVERDAFMDRAEEMDNRVAELELDAQLLQERSEHVFAQLENAVEVSLEPLERALNSKGINTDNLLTEVKRAYSGIGGPVTPLNFSAQSVIHDPLSDRANQLLRNLDQVNLMKIASQKVPLAHPVRGSYRYTSGYGTRRDPKTGGRRMHNGTDMAGPLGTDIVATGDGVVTFAGRQSGYGNLVKIRHAQGFETYYAHLYRIRVKPGQKVSRGDHIGDMGNSGRSTGVHLHYEVRISGKPVNAMTYIKAARDVF